VNGDMARKHKIVSITPVPFPDTVWCLCGWRYRVIDCRDWGSTAIKDKLLDEFNDHWRGMIAEDQKKK